MVQPLDSPQTVLRSSRGGAESRLAFCAPRSTLVRFPSYGRAAARHSLPVAKDFQFNFECELFRTNSEPVEETQDGAGPRSGLRGNASIFDYYCKKPYSRGSDGQTNTEQTRSSQEHTEQEPTFSPFRRGNLQYHESDCGLGGSGHDSEPGGDDSSVAQGSATAARKSNHRGLLRVTSDPHDQQRRSRPPPAALDPLDDGQVWKTVARRNISSSPPTFVTCDCKKSVGEVLQDEDFSSSSRSTASQGTSEVQFSKSAYRITGVASSNDSYPDLRHKVCQRTNVRGHLPPPVIQRLRTSPACPSKVPLNIYRSSGFSHQHTNRLRHDRARSLSFIRENVYSLPLSISTLFNPLSKVVVGTLTSVWRHTHIPTSSGTHTSMHTYVHPYTHAYTKTNAYTRPYTD